MRVGNQPVLYETPPLFGKNYLTKKLHFERTTLQTQLKIGFFNTITQNLLADLCIKIATHQ